MARRAPFIGPDWRGAGAPAHNRPLMRVLRPGSVGKVSGLTIIELMVTLAVLAVLVTVSAPNLQSMIFNWRLTASANDLLADLSTARGQAATLGVPVTVCASANAANCGGAWTQGRIVFSDANANGQVDAADGDRILAVGEAAHPNLTLAVANLADATRIRFSSTGLAEGVSGGGATFKLCDQRQGLHGRTVTVSLPGRASAAAVQCP